MDKSNNFRKEFVGNCCYRMDESLRMVNIALTDVSETQLWKKPNLSLNSIGNLILHLCGNMTQYGIASLAETEDNRNRDLEFSTEGGLTKKELLQKLAETVEAVKASMNKTPMERLLKTTKVQGFEFSGIGNCIHVVEHFSYHTGQIAFWVKLLTDKQLGFYDGINLNSKNGK